MKKFGRFRIATVATLSATALALTACSGSGDGGDSSNKAVGGLEIDVKPTGDYNEKERDEIKDGGELTLALQPQVGDAMGDVGADRLAVTIERGDHRRAGGPGPRAAGRRCADRR